MSTVLPECEDEDVTEDEFEPDVEFVPLGPDRGPLSAKNPTNAAAAMMTTNTTTTVLFMAIDILPAH